jgi:hypothetical protein
VQTATSRCSNPQSSTFSPFMACILLFCGSYDQRTRGMHGPLATLRAGISASDSCLIPVVLPGLNLSRSCQHHFFLSDPAHWVCLVVLLALSQYYPEQRTKEFRLAATLRILLTASNGVNCDNIYRPMNVEQPPGFKIPTY